jgi:hypothetical protein
MRLHLRYNKFMRDRVIDQSTPQEDVRLEHVETLTIMVTYPNEAAYEVAFKRMNSYGSRVSYEEALDYERYNRGYTR